MREFVYYQVLQDNQPVCQCGSLEDAEMMVRLGENRTIKKFQFLPPDTIDTQAETIEEYKLSTKIDLPERQQIPFTTGS